MTEKKHPFNPYFIPLWFGGWLFCVAIFILVSKQNIIHSIFRLIKNYGAEELLLNIPRTYRVHEFLTARLQFDRWESIAVFYCIAITSILISIALSMLTARQFLYWLSQTNSGWQTILEPRVVKHFRWFFRFSIFGLVVFLYDILVGTSRLDKPSQALNSIHSSNFGYFKLIVAATLVVFFAQAIHFIRFRLYHNEKLTIKNNS